MPAITIRDVPPEVRDELAARAARAGRSLQEHLRLELTQLARRPDNAELMRRVRDRKARYDMEVSADTIIDEITAGRQRG
jgi:plasmid stability protein